MKAMTFEYFAASYNRKRLRSVLGCHSPGWFPEHWVSQQHQEKPVA